MSSRIAMPIEAQASALVSFLAQAQHTLPIEVARDICGAMRAAKEPAARFLKTALASQNIELKHTSCLKALALMDGFGGHVSRPKPTWDVAQYAFDAPAISPRVKRHNKCTDATADLCKRLVEDLSDTRTPPYARVVRNLDYLEFIFEGEPQPDARYILACKAPDGSACEMVEDDVSSAVERIRRVVEGQFKGWLDGAAKIPPSKAGNLRLLKDGEVVAEGPESEILAACERDEAFALDADTLLRLPASSRHYRVQHVPATGGEVVFAEDALIERTWRRLEAFYRNNEEDFSWFLSERQREAAEGRFHSDGIDTERLVDELTKRNMSVAQAKARVGMDDEQWSAMMQTGEVSRDALFGLCEMLELASANELYVDLRSPAWMPATEGELIALWMKNFGHLRLSVSGNAEGTSFARWVLEQLEKLNPRSADPDVIQGIVDKAEARGLRLCVTFGKRFVSDLPVPRERLAMVGHLSVWDRKEVVSQQGALPIEAGSAEDKWTAMDDEYLLRFNMVSMTVGDLTSLQQEVGRARGEGQEPGFETTSFAAVRVFKGRKDSAHLAHTAMTRMEAVNRLILAGALDMWLEKSNESEMLMVPKNVFHAAASCPLIRVGNHVGFDTGTFQRLVLEYAG